MPGKDDDVRQAEDRAELPATNGWRCAQDASGLPAHSEMLINSVSGEVIVVSICNG